MANVMQMWDGDIRCVRSMDDFLQLVDEYMGMEARMYLEEMHDDSDAAWAYCEEVEREKDGWRDHHKEVLSAIRKHSEKLAGLISEKELNRREISNVCGAIGVITYKEMNR